MLPGSLKRIRRIGGRVTKGSNRLSGNDMSDVWEREVTESLKCWRVMSRDVTSSHSNLTMFELRTFSADSKFVKFFHVPIVELEPQVYTIGTTCLDPPATGTPIEQMRIA